MRLKRRVFVDSLIAATLSAGRISMASQNTIMQAQAFLDSARDSWVDWNVPYEDGQILHNKVIELGAKEILEIGTSTGHSTIWLAMAAAQTGGVVRTIEIDERRYNIAVANFERAGVSHLVEATLGDAHQYVPALTGKFDFVFSDADKDWYIQYFKDVAPKMNPGGCVAAHNVLRHGGANIEQYIRFVQSAEGFSTDIVEGSGEGFAFTCKVEG